MTVTKVGITYLMLFFDSSSLPDNHCVAEFAHYVSLVQLIYIRSHIIGLRKIEVDVLLGHTLVHV